MEDRQTRLIQQKLDKMEDAREYAGSVYRYLPSVVGEQNKLAQWRKKGN
jgi:hypothetical protein